MLRTITAMLKLYELSVAVANALPAVKETADWVTPFDHGNGVIQLIDELVDNDTKVITAGSKRLGFELGTSETGPVNLAPYGHGILLAGPSASGKSTVATHFIETAIDQKYQVVVSTPKGTTTSTRPWSWGTRCHSSSQRSDASLKRSGSQRGDFA